MGQGTETREKKTWMLLVRPAGSRRREERHPIARPVIQLLISVDIADTGMQPARCLAPDKAIVAHPVVFEGHARLSIPSRFWRNLRSSNALKWLSPWFLGAPHCDAIHHLPGGPHCNLYAAFVNLVKSTQYRATRKLHSLSPQSYTLERPKLAPF